MGDWDVLVCHLGSKVRPPDAREHLFQWSLLREVGCFLWKNSQQGLLLGMNTLTLGFCWPANAEDALFRRVVN